MFWFRAARTPPLLKQFMPWLHLTEALTQSKFKCISISDMFLKPWQAFDPVSSAECRKQRWLGTIFPILVYLIMRCVCLIVYLESSTSFIDLVPDGPLRSSSPNVILLRGIVCQMITGRCHSHFPRGLALMSFVMPLWENCCCLGCISLLVLHLKCLRLLILRLLLLSINYHCELALRGRAGMWLYNTTAAEADTQRPNISLRITPSLDPSIGIAFSHETHKHRSQ